MSSCRGIGWAVVASTVLSPLASTMASADEGGGLVGWVEKRNAYSSGAAAVWWVPRPADYRLMAPGSLKDWRRRWNLTDTGSLEGAVIFHGGALRSRTAAALEKLTPEDFRLRADSAGYRAGPGGKDLGADLDLVGPGAAYERWKKTPDYQQWLEETGQAETPE